MPRLLSAACHPGPYWSRMGQARQCARQRRPHPPAHCGQAGNLALRARTLPNNSRAAAELRKTPDNRVTTQAAVNGARHRCRTCGKTCGRSRRVARRQQGVGVQGRWAPADPHRLHRPRSPPGARGEGRARGNRAALGPSRGSSPQQAMPDGLTAGPSPPAAPLTRSLHRRAPQFEVPSTSGAPAAVQVGAELHTRLRAPAAAPSRPKIQI